jgi:hypothetical protein
MKFNLFIFSFIFFNSLGFRAELSPDRNFSDKNKREPNYYCNSNCNNSVYNNFDNSIQVIKKPFFSMFRSDNLIDRANTTIKINYLSEKIFRHQVEILDKDTIERFSKYEDFYWQNHVAHNLSGCDISNLFNQFNFYQFPEFIKFLKCTGNFDEHIKTLKYKLHDPEFDRLAQIIHIDRYETLQDFINNEFKKIQQSKALLEQKERIRTKQIIDRDLTNHVQDQLLKEDLYKSNNYDNEDYFNRHHKNYALNLNVEEFLLDKGFSTNKYKGCFGNNIQQKIHSECLEILNKAYRLNRSNLSYESRNLHNEVIQINDISIEANRYGKINLATNLNKYSKSALNWLYTFIQGGPVVKWAREGSWIGVQRFAQTVTHPSELVQCSIKMGKSIYKIFNEISGFMDDVQIFNLVNNPEKIQNRVEGYVDNATQFYNYASNFIAEKSKNLTLKDIPEITENITKEVAANIVEAYLTGKTLTALGDIISKTPRAITFVQNNFKALPKERVVSLATLESGEIVQVRLAENGAKLFAQDSNQIIDKAKKVIHIGENQVKISATENGARVIAANEVAIQMEGNKLHWNTWQNLPKSKINNLTVAKIGDFYYTEHAITRMLPVGLGNPASHTAYGLNTIVSKRYNRGIPTLFVDEVAKNGVINHLAKTTMPVVEKKLGNVAIRIDLNTNIIYSVLIKSDIK